MEDLYQMIIPTKWEIKKLKERKKIFKDKQRAREFEEQDDLIKDTPHEFIKH